MYLQGGSVPELSIYMQKTRVIITGGSGLLATNWARYIKDECDVQLFLHNNIVNIPGEWILGARPKIYMEKNPTFRMQRAHQIKMFYTKLPKYASNYTDLNCGHMAVYFAAEHLKADTIHMYGFDSIFDFNLRSYTDTFINSDRGNMNNNRLANNWRPIWTHMWNEFKDVKFILHHTHDKFKVEHGDNVTCEVYPSLKEAETIKFDKDGLPDMNVTDA